MNNSLLLIIFFAAFLGIMFFQTRRQQKRIKEIRDAQAAVGVGDTIILTCGLHGGVVGADEKNITVEIAPGVHTVWDRQAVMSVESKGTTVEENNVAENPKEITEVEEDRS